MLAVTYEWLVVPGKEDQFVEAWTRLTEAMHSGCGSFGSRLHRGDDGRWLGYARWPDLAARDGCRHGELEAVRLMADATAGPPVQNTWRLVHDRLREPRRP